MEKSTIEHLRKRLKELRKAHALSQEDFAHLAGIDYKFYQSVEAGRRKELRVSTLEKLSKAYGIEVYELLSPETPPTKLASTASRVRKTGKVHQKAS